MFWMRSGTELRQFLRIFLPFFSFQDLHVRYVSVLRETSSIIFTTESVSDIVLFFLLNILFGCFVSIKMFKKCLSVIKISGS